jgi:hypothetical protein
MPDECRMRTLAHIVPEEPEVREMHRYSQIHQGERTNTLRRLFPPYLVEWQDGTSMRVHAVAQATDGTVILQPDSMVEPGQTTSEPQRI